MSLHVKDFAGGVVIEAGADQRAVTELLKADSFDVAPRGALIAASERSDYVTLNDNSGNPWSRLLGLLSVAGISTNKVLCIGEGAVAGVSRYIFSLIDRQGQASPVAYVAGQLFGAESGGTPSPTGQGVYVSGFTFPGMFFVRYASPGNPPPGAAVQVQVSLVCLGAREGFAARTAPGLYALMDDGTTLIVANQIARFDSLGTGSSGLLTVPTANKGEGAANGGTNGKQLYPRGVVFYNGHAFIWGFDQSDATNGEGPNRVMFCNLAQPLKWGNDDVGAVGADRAFTDSDAIVLGDAGEIVRAGLRWGGRLWFGTNRQLHFIAGNGRDSFLTDGSTPVADSKNVVGPGAMIEGPDRKLYGVSDDGLWVYDGQTFLPLYTKLRDFGGYSAGYWDLIWTDPTATAAAYPGRTNQDLVWTAIDRERRQVLIGIPFCNATAGYGSGSDTVVVKYHVDGGGFSRQVFTAIGLSAAGYFQRIGQQPETRFVGTATASQKTIQRYAYKATAASSPAMPSNLPDVIFGWYAPFGPDGAGVIRRVYLTLAWESASALPLVFTMKTTIDQNTIDSFKLSVQSTTPAGPVDGDLWLDTSESDTSLGNGTGGPSIEIRGGYLLKTYNANSGQWQNIAGLGQKGTRATIPIPVTRLTGARYTVQATTSSAAGRFQWEGLGFDPAHGREAA